MHSAPSLAMLIVMLAVGLSAMPLSGADGSNRPNFILVFCDDQGYQDLGCFGS